ncbi:hypothetical protein BD413DRAFT_606945 [Trametes elegans]|nr:hypothetical protein BD413DRAFT_606945 [Trametes elegans]
MKRLVPDWPHCYPERDSDLLEYIPGRCIANDKLRHAERRREFNVDGLRRLSAEPVRRSPDDIESIRKLADGGFNRVLLIAMRDGFRMIARIPYPATAPKYFSVASEMATLAFLRLSSGPQTLKVYVYSPPPDNAAGTEYSFMQYIEGRSLATALADLDAGNNVFILRQLAQLESQMVSIAFPAGGSLYYTEDLARVTGGASSLRTWPGVTLEDKRFCVSPETNLPLWYGRRSQLDVGRGPLSPFTQMPKQPLIKGAEKERAYLQREPYQYQEQQPSNRIDKLDRYPRVAPSLTFRDSTVDHFCVLHTALQPSNDIVSWSPDSNSYIIVGLGDWQHTSILPLSLQAGISQQLQIYDDASWQPMTPPSESLPQTLDDSDKTQRRRKVELYRRRLLHHFMVRRRLFRYARAPWEGQTLDLKVALIQATENWEMLAREGVPCPFAFYPDDVCETLKMDAVQRRADESLEVVRGMIGVGPEDWVPAEHYEEAKVHSEQMKRIGLAALEEEEERARVAAQWPVDDMDEENYILWRTENHDRKDGRKIQDTVEASPSRARRLSGRHSELFRRPQRYVQIF